MLTSTSTRPHCVEHRGRGGGQVARSVRSAATGRAWRPSASISSAVVVEAARERPGVGLLHGGRVLAGLAFGDGTGADGDVVADLGQLDGAGLADPTAGPGDEGDPLRGAHRRPPSRCRRRCAGPCPGRRRSPRRGGRSRSRRPATCRSPEPPRRDEGRRGRSWRARAGSSRPWPGRRPPGRRGRPRRAARSFSP